MSNHEITIGHASVTFEQVEVDLDYNDILENIEDTIANRVSDQIGDEAWDAVEYQMGDAISERLEDLEEAVWKAIAQLGSAETDGNSWAGAAREYLLSMSPTAPPEYGHAQYVRVRAIVREEMATVLLSFAEAVNERLGAEIAVAPGG